LTEHPKLRPVEAFPAQHNGQQVLCLRDPLHYAERILFVPMGLVPILGLLDGSRDLRDIQADLMRRTGELFPSDQIREVLHLLDEHLFLEGERLRAKRREVEGSFLASPLRAPFLAGRGYARDPAQLSATMEGFFSHPEGPGPIQGPGEGPPVRGALAPHIDFMRGGPVFAHAYKALAQGGGPEVFVVLGTAHAGAERLYALTRKDFDTPFGPLPTDRDFIDDLVEEAGEGYFADELSHRAEHSVEFQAVFLKYVFGGRGPVRLVPILCGSFHEFVLSGTSPKEDERVARFLRGLRRAAEARAGRISFIASADLSHVGPRFGDPHPLSHDHLSSIGAADRAMLANVEALDAEGFFRFVQAERDRRRVCGLSPIYTLLHVVGAREGRLLKYAQWPDPHGTVTFASMVFS
jgi:AmmeMemoRadiSam system protein B